MSTHYLLMTLCLLASAPAWSEQHCPQDIDGLLAHQQLTREYEQMSFAVQHIGEGDQYSRSERYEPLRQPGQRWVLLELNGEQPDAEARERFARQRASQGNPLLGYLQDRQADEFTLIATSESRHTYTFQPDKIEVGSGGKNTLNVAEFVRGKLTLLNDPQVGCVLTVNLSNPKSFSPRTGVKVKTFSLTSRFLLDPVSGLFFPHSSNLVLRGRAFLVAGFDVMNRATYSAISLAPGRNT